MGAIQNSFNQLLGIGAGAIGTAKLLSNQSESNKLKAIDMAEELQGPTNKLNLEIKGYNERLNEVEKGFDRTSKGLSERMHKNPTKRTRTQYLNALKSYQDELDSLRNQYEGFKERRDILSARHDIVNKALSKNKVGINLADIREPRKKLTLEEEILKESSGGKK